ncbi:exonuclease 1 [Tanacetum coccineum]
MVLQACVLGGCDYLSNLSGVGLKPAIHVMKKHKKMMRTRDDYLEVLQALKPIDVDEDEKLEYIKKFTKALNAYKHQRIIFEYNKNYYEYESSRLVCGKVFGSFTEEMVLQACVLGGCDYLSNLSGVGLKPAIHVMKKHKKMMTTRDDYLEVLRALKPIDVDEDEKLEYIKKFTKALNAYKHQRPSEYIVGGYIYSQAELIDKDELKINLEMERLFKATSTLMKAKVRRAIEGDKIPNISWDILIRKDRNLLFLCSQEDGDWLDEPCKVKKSEFLHALCQSIESPTGPLRSLHFENGNRANNLTTVRMLNASFCFGSSKSFILKSFPTPFSYLVGQGWDVSFQEKGLDRSIETPRGGWKKSSFTSIDLGWVYINLLPMIDCMASWIFRFWAPVDWWSHQLDLGSTVLVDPGKPCTERKPVKKAGCSDCKCRRYEKGGIVAIVEEEAHGVWVEEIVVWCKPNPTSV